MTSTATTLASVRPTATVATTSSSLRTRLTTVGIAAVPIQFAVGSTVRLAPSDLAFGASTVLLLAVDRAPSRRLLRLWIVLFAVVTWAVVIGTGRGSILPSAMLDRWLGAVALLAAAFATSALDGARIARGLRAASWVALACHVAVALDPAVAGSRVSGRNAGFLVDPNNAGVLLASLLVLEVARAADALRDRQRLGWRWVVLLGGLTWALIGTGSRTGWSSLAAGLLVVAAVHRDQLLALAHRRALRLATLGIVLAIALRATFESQFRSLGARPDNIARRGEVLEQSWRSFAESPLTGGGLLHTLELGYGFPHNSLLWLLGDAGLAGVAAFVTVAVVPVAWLVRAPGAAPLARPLLAALVTMIVASVGIEALYQRQWWVYIGAAAALSTTVRRTPWRR